MNSKAAKLKKTLTAIAIAAIFLGLILFGFHFSCHIKALVDNQTTLAHNIIINPLA